MRSHAPSVRWNRTFGAFSRPRLIAIMEFPVLFQGAKPSNIRRSTASWIMPRFLNLAPFIQWVACSKIVETMQPSVAEGAALKQATPPALLRPAVAPSPTCVPTGTMPRRSGGQRRLPHWTNPFWIKRIRNYNETYWNKRVMAPSSLIFYLGVSKKKNLSITTSFFLTVILTHTLPKYTTILHGHATLCSMFAVPPKLIRLLPLKAWKTYSFSFPLRLGLEDTTEIRKPLLWSGDEPSWNRMRRQHSRTRDFNGATALKIL